MIGLFSIFAAAGAFMALTEFLASAPRFAHRRIDNNPPPNAPSTVERAVRFAINGSVSLAIYGTVLYFIPTWIIAPENTAWPIALVHLAGTLLLYDFLYYFMHRFWFHHPASMQRLHGVHHRARSPTAVDSLFLNPVEVALGVILLLASTAAVGPVSHETLLWIVGLHTGANLVTHANLVFPWRVFFLWNHWAVTHHVHHRIDMESNYASIFPFWDLMFRTYREGAPPLARENA